MMYECIEPIELVKCSGDEAFSQGHKLNVSAGDKFILLQYDAFERMATMVAFEHGPCTYVRLSTGTLREHFKELS